MKIVVRVECDLCADSDVSHDIVLRVIADGSVRIKGHSDTRMCRAVEVLDEGLVWFTCGWFVEALWKRLSGDEPGGVDVRYCNACTTCVIPTDRFQQCPFCNQAGSIIPVEAWDHAVNVASGKRANRQMRDLTPSFRRAPKTIMEALLA